MTKKEQQKQKDLNSEVIKPEIEVQYQTHCAKCGANLAQTGYVENNYKRYCGPACAA